MRKIELKYNTPIMGVGVIPKGTAFKVEKFNSRYVYVRYGRCSLRLLRKDIKIVY